MVPTTKAKKRKQRQLDVLYAWIKCFIWVSRVFSSKIEAVFLVKPMTQTNKRTNEKGSRFAVQTKLTGHENLTFQIFYFIITNISPWTFFKRPILLPYFYESSIPFFRSIDYNSAETKIYIQLQSILHFSRLSFMP